MPIRRRATRALAAVLSSLIGSVLAAPAASAQGYTFSTLDGPGTALAPASGINPAGQIVGSYSDAASNTHGVLASPTVAVVSEQASIALVVAGLDLVGAVARRRSRVTA